MGLGSQLSENESAPKEPQPDANAGFAGVRPAPTDAELMGEGVRGELARVNERQTVPGSADARQEDQHKEQVQNQLIENARAEIRTAEGGMFTSLTAAQTAAIAALHASMNSNPDPAVLVAQINALKQAEVAPPTEEDRKKAEKDAEHVREATAALLIALGLGSEASQLTVQAASPAKESLLAEMKDMLTHETPHHGVTHHHAKPHAKGQAIG